MLQPMKIGCVWAADRDGGADLKVLQQFTACLLETVPSEEEQTPKASRREKRDQHSECWPEEGAEGAGSQLVRGPGSPGPQAGDLLGEWINSSEVRPVTKTSARGAPRSFSDAHNSRTRSPVYLARFTGRDTGPECLAQGRSHP